MEMQSMAGAKAQVKKARRIRRRVPMPVFAQLPETGLLRLDQFVPSCIPVGKSSWWKLVKAGTAPQPVKLSARCTVWRAEELRAFVESV